MPIRIMIDAAKTIPPIAQPDSGPAGGSYSVVAAAAVTLL